MTDEYIELLTRIFIGVILRFKPKINAGEEKEFFLKVLRRYMRLFDKNSFLNEYSYNLNLNRLK